MSANKPYILHNYKMDKQLNNRFSANIQQKDVL